MLAFEDDAMRPGHRSEGPSVGQRTPKEEFAKCYQSWVRRWERCVAKDGDYVEK